MVAVIIPVLNGGDVFVDCISALSLQNLDLQTKIVMDCCSTDGSAQRAKKLGFRVETVPKGTFDHGGTRALAVELVDDAIIVMLTQDAVLEGSDSLHYLVSAFDDPQVVAAYGRQLPHHGADPLAAYARTKNYGTEGYVTDLKALWPVGIRKAYMSNSFAAYRRSALLEIGNFPSKLILGEDFFCAGKMLKAGYKIAYVAQAMVRHSHNYTLLEEFRRYFDIGVFHAEQSWLLHDFGFANGEGVNFALGQMKWLWQQGHVLSIPRSILHSAAKFVGYKIGRQHRRLGPSVARHLTMHKLYFAASPSGENLSRP